MTEAGDEAPGRYILHRKNGAGIHQPIGRFKSATAAKEHAEQDALMRGLITMPYQWSVSHYGMWESICPDWNKPRLSDHPCNDYIVIDSEWESLDESVTIELPPYEERSDL